MDAGLGKRETLRRLAAFEQAAGQLDGIVISHEHSDHVGGLAALISQWRSTSIYLSEGTHAEVVRILPERHRKRLQRVEFIQAGQRFAVGDIEVAPFAIPHDAADPLGFTFCAGGVKLGVVTDLGYLPQLVKHHLRDSDALVLESNHDLEMLRSGPYPWYVKQRVMSREGHLSNTALGEFLRDEFDRQARVLVLAHLSQQNNHPEIARLEAASALEQLDARETKLAVSSQAEPTEVFWF